MREPILRYLDLLRLETPYIFTHENLPLYSYMTLKKLNDWILCFHAQAFAEIALLGSVQFQIF